MAKLLLQPRLFSAAILLVCVAGEIATIRSRFAWGEEDGPRTWIELQETIGRAIENDRKYLRRKADWVSSDMRMEELKRRGGWTLEILGRDEGVRGNRRETRDRSLGRESSDRQGRLLESERFIEIGLVRKFWEEQRKNRADVSDERIAQLDSVAKLAVDLNDSAEVAAIAFLEVFFGRLKRESLQSLVANEEENARVLEVRLAQDEILLGKVLESRALLAENQGSLFEVDLKLKRNLEELCAIWEDSALAPEDLGEPSMGESGIYESAPLEELVAVALESRFDFRAAQAALEVQVSARSLVSEKPELEFGMLGRYGSYDRDYLDEGRDDSSFDLQFELGLTVPLSLASRNQYRIRRHQMLTKSRILDLETLRGELSREVRVAHDTYLLSKEMVRIEELKVAKEEESNRVTRLTVLTMPESLTTDAEGALRDSENALLRASMNLVNARQKAWLAWIDLLSAMGRLAPIDPTDAMAPRVREN